MDIKEYNSQNAGKQVLVLQEKEIKSLMHFSSIAKDAKVLKGLIVAGKYAGFTDSYRLAAIKDTREELTGADIAMYSMPALEELKKEMCIRDRPKRVVQGYDRNRIQILTAIAEKKLYVPLSMKDLFVNVPGGLSIEDPAADLAVLMSILSVHKGFATVSYTHLERSC